MPNISSDYTKNRAIKSERAKVLIYEGIENIKILDISDYGKWQLRFTMAHAVEIAEQETEVRMCAKAHKIVKEMMTGISHGDMPRKIADKFIQKLTE